MALDGSIRLRRIKTPLEERNTHCTHPETSGLLRGTVASQLSLLLSPLGPRQLRPAEQPRVALWARRLPALALCACPASC